MHSSSLARGSINKPADSANLSKVLRSAWLSICSASFTPLEVASSTGLGLRTQVSESYFSCSAMHHG